MKTIEDRIKDNIIRDYGKIKSKEELEIHIKQHQKHKANLFEDYIAKSFPKNFFKNKRVLEIGCGFGGNTIHLVKEYNTYAIGIDLDEDAILIAKDIARENQLNKNIFINCPAEKISNYVDEKFDIIISMQVLEHVQDVKKSIEEMLELLNNNGYIYIHVPNYDSKFETHYRLKMPSNKKEDFIKMLQEKNIDISFAESLNFVNKQYFVDILKKLTFNKAFILPYENEPYRKYMDIPQKSLISFFPYVGYIIRKIVYFIKPPNGLTIIIKK